MAHHKIEFDRVCKNCDGTGLYAGLAERDGAAVVCYCCHGTGCEHIVVEWDDFKKRQPRKLVERVFEANPGIILSKTVGGKKVELSHFGGILYNDWQNGVPFPPKSENREHLCPGWWYQSVDGEKRPQWDECIVCGCFSDCKSFAKKQKCWAKWDKEFGQGKKKKGK